VSLDPDIISVYTDEIIALSETTRAPRHLPHPVRAAKAVSPVCGSEVTLELDTDGDIITGIGWEIEACALTRAAVAIVAGAAIGRTRAEVAHAGGLMRAMLAGEDVRPAGAFEKLGILAPVRDYPARHNALLLPFEAVEKAFMRGMR
jgi:NifU-like protein involved in Fe-S cluster formation